MPIDVSTPDGSSFSFPDGTPQDVITGALRAHFGQGVPQQAAPVQPIGASDLVRAAGRGVPIIGGLLDKANAATYAALAPLAPGDTTVSHAPSFSERYGENLEKEKAKDTGFDVQHPVASTVAQLAGGVGSTGLAATTPLGARLLGLTGTTLPGMIWRGAASGAGLSAADAAVRGGDPIAAAGIGGALGTVAPVVGRGISAAVEPLVSTARGIANPAEEATRRVATAANRDITAGTAGMTPQEFQAAQAAGQPVNVMDIGGETVRGLARSAANTSPEGRAVLDRAINDRFESQTGRLTDWLRSTFHYPDAVAQQEALDQVARTTNRANYQRAMQEGAGGVWSPELERLAGSTAVSSAMQRAAANAKDEAIVSGYGAMNPRITFTPDGRIQFTKGPTGVPTYPDLQFWDLTRRELSDAAQRAGPGTSEARRLNSFANAMNAELDRIVPSYQAARLGAARFFGANDALEAGQNFVTSKMENAQARNALAQMSPQERQLFQDGFVDTLVNKIRESGDRRSIMNQVGNSPAARERLAIALGPQRAAQLETFLRTEGIMDLARPAVQGNSSTARQLAELGLAGGAYTLGTGGNILNPDPTSVLNAALLYGAARGRNAIDHRVARQVAELLASNNIGRVQSAMQMLSQPRMLGALRNADAGLASIAARGGTSLMTH